MELNKIYNEDCLDTMSRMTDDFVDLILTSPPYNMNLRIRKGKYCSRQIIQEEFSTKYHDFSDNLPIDEFYNLHSKILSEMLRVSNIIFYNIQIVTGSKVAFFKMIGDYAEYIKDIIIWDKVNAQPAMKYNVLNRQSELIVVLEKKNAISRLFSKCNFERGTLSDVWHIKRERKFDKKHGASFPEELATRVITMFSNEGDLIYDPFMGTGTVAKVSKDNNRNYIGSEISKSYCEIIENRLKQ